MPDRHPGGLAPRRQSRLADTELGGDHRGRRTLGIPVQRDRVTLELVWIIIPCHRVGSSRFPQEHPGIERVQHMGQAPSPITTRPEVDVRLPCL